MGNAPDPYRALRSAEPTPDEDVCRCSELEAAVLREMFAENPLYCVQCNGEVDPARIGFDEELAGRIANWHKLQMFQYMLLVSNQNSSAKSLADPNSAFNELGRAIVKVLNTYLKSYYWMYFDEESEKTDKPTVCPSCKQLLTRYRGTDAFVCEACLIMM